MACRDIDLLWKEYFRDPSKFADYRGSKKGSRAPDFRHTKTREPLWLNNRHNPSWIHDELRKRDVKAAAPLTTSGENNAVYLYEGALLDLINACGNEKDLLKGRKMHNSVLQRGLETTDNGIGTAMVRMYAKCGALAEAQEVFERVPVHDDVASWNSLIIGYAKHGLCDEALKCFKRMQDSGLSPDAPTFISLLKACASIGAAEKGEEIHAEVKRQALLPSNIILGTALVDMYAKCGKLEKAHDVFDGLTTWDVAAWNALIAGYAQHGLGDEALNCFDRMQDYGFYPDVVTFVCILKACGSIGALEKGEEIHANIDGQGLLESNITLGNALVSMYAKCGALSKAQEVFDELRAHNVVSWNALIAGYGQHGLHEEALACYEQMRSEGFFPDASTFVCVVKACGETRAIEKGAEIHVEIGRQGLVGKHIMLGTALVEMYVKCGALLKAQEVFDELHVRDLVSWNVLIGGYAELGHGDEALTLYAQMQNEGHTPSAVTFVHILKACGSLGGAEKGQEIYSEAIKEAQEIHGEVIRHGLLDKNIVLGTALVDMYAKCGVLAKAAQVFDELAERDVATWAALVGGYAQLGLGDEALKCFGRMQSAGISPNAASYVHALKACGSTGAAENGEEMHNQVRSHGLLQKNIMVGTAVVDMYAKCGLLAKAQEVFDELSTMDVACWSALIAGYAQHGLGDEALCCYDAMREQGLSPEMTTFVCILKACGNLGALERGEEIRAEVNEQVGMEESIMIGNALVDMYAKCGALARAQEVFDELSWRNVVSWTELMAGYAQLGDIKRVCDSLNTMVGEHIEPNVVTFLILHTACSHAGLVEEGKIFFDIMATIYAIFPTLEHETCLVDLLSRTGQFQEATGFIEKVQPLDHRPRLWSALLGACQNGVTAELGRCVIKHGIPLDPHYHSTYVCMSNIYAAACTTKDADGVEAD